MQCDFDKKENAFTIKFKDLPLLKHTPQTPCIEIAHNDPAFRMHPKYISYYKIKNQISDPLPLRNVKLRQDSDKIIIDFENAIRMTLIIIDGRLEIKPEYLFDDLELRKRYNYFTINLAASSNDAIYGCGEQFSFLNLRGRSVPLWTQEPGIVKTKNLKKWIADLVLGAGGEWWSTYYPQPTFVSSKNYFVHINTYAFAEFDFRKQNQNILHVNELPDSIVIDVQDSAIKTLGSLTNYLGRQRPLPDWIINGVIMGIGGGLDSARSNSVPMKIARAKAKKTQIAAIWSEDWSGLRQFPAQTRLFWNWKYDPDYYPKLPEYIKELRKEGIRYMGYNNCFLMREGEMYEYAKAHDFFVKDRNGQIYQLPMFSFSAPILDLTNPETITWFKSIIKDHMIGIGLDGWMCDFAEYIPIDAQMHSKVDPYLHHNEYPVLWAKINAEAVHEAGRDTGEDAIVFFSRSGNYMSTRYSPLIWAGDQSMTFWLDMGLPAAINAGISIGFSGVGFTHSDIAGEFRFPGTKRTKELFMRWTEYAAFTCVMRTHEAKEKSGWDQDTDEETLEHFAKFSRIHAKLVPYLKHAVQEYTDTGVPVIRHPYLHYEADPLLHAIKPRSLQYEYLLGKDLLVAPVYTKGAKQRKLYLPKDHWIHLWSGKEFHGGWVTVPAPCGEIPVFYRKQSDFIPLFLSLKMA